MYNYSQGHICQCLSRIATLRRNSPVLIAGSRKKTGQEFVEGVLSLARGLLQLGLNAGDVVAISAFNSDWYLEWLLAIAFVGGVAAPLNYRWSFEEASLAMVVVRPRMLVTDETCNYWHSKLSNVVVPSLKWLVSMGDPSSEFINTCNVTTEALKKNSVKSLPLNYIWAPEGVAIICFTSGTTGRPKGVTISHSALIVQSLAKISIVGYGEDDVYLHIAPLCHIGGLSSAMAMLMVGACHVLIPKFESKSAIEAIEQHHVTSLITVPTIMADIVSLLRKKETWKGKDSVKKILNGGGGLSIELIKATTKFFPRAKLLSAYGMTETCSSLTFMTLYVPTLETCCELLQTNGKMRMSNSFNQQQGVCVGKPAPHVELKICADGFSHVGRILTRGPHVMLGYWDQLSAKAPDSSNEVWLDTGDVGSIDENGFVWLIGRTNGRIKTGGENVYPEEVEAVLSQHPGIIGIVVVGIPDARLTEMVVACIRLRENWQWSEPSDQWPKKTKLLLSREILRQFCRENNLTGFKIPKTFILWRKAFPLTTTGKIRRDQVQREVISCLQSLSSNL